MKFTLTWLLALLATVCVYAQPIIKAGEYFVGTFDPGAGNGIAFTAADGSWNEALESIIAQNQTFASGSNPRLLNVRLKDNSNNWGPLFKKVIFVEQVLTGSQSVSIGAAEFFFGNFDPGAGSGIVMPVFDNNFDEAVETVLKSQYVANLSSSPVLFNVRVRDANNAWGPVFKKVIFKEAVQTTNRSVNVSQGEFFFGNFDPGLGSGTPILALDGNYNEAVETILKSPYTVSLGSSPLLFNIRVKDADGNWGPVFKKVIFNEDVETLNRAVSISQAEFFFGNFDPGAGSGIPILAMDGNFDEAVEAVLKSAYTASLGSSPVLFNIRVKDANNSWGPLFKKTIFFEDVRDQAREVEITQAEYFFGNFDPGSGTGTPIIAFDGQLSEAVETVLRTSATWTATSGPILFNIRMRDGDGHWGPVFKRTIFPYGANTSLNLITQGDATSVCPGGSVTLNYTGPNGFTSTWFDGSNGSTITFTPAQSGYYSVSATNGSETYTDSILVSFLSAPAPQVTPSGTILACSSSNITLATASVSGYSYQWFLNGTSIPAATTASYFPTAYGTYAVRVIDNSTTCATTSASTVIGTTSAISIINGSGGCALPITLNASAGTGNSYIWYFNGTPISGATGATYSAAQAGSYTVQVTNGACASTSPAVNVTGSISTPTITASGPTTFCQGGSVTLTSSATSGNTWSTGATSQSITVNQSGAYSVSFNNGSGCTATSASTAVTVNSANTVGTPSSNPTVCVNSALQPITISTTGATSIGSATGLPAGVSASWSSNTITIVGTPTVAGNFNYTIPLSGGCGSLQATGSITVVAAPAVTIANASICAGQTATVTATVSIAGAYNYVWSVPAQSTNPGNVASFSTSIAGSYGVTVSTTGSPVCSSSIANGVVTVIAPPAVSVNSAEICSNAMATITANAQPAGAYQYAWTVPAGAANPGNVANFATAVAGNYSVVASTIGATACTSSPASGTVGVTQVVTPVFELVGPYCSGEQIPALPTTSLNNVSGMWSPAINNTATTDYTFTPNGGNCINSATLTIEVSENGCTDPLAINYNGAAVCDDGSCTYTGIPGCTNATACNYDAAATVDNFTCTFPGCIDVLACNYSGNAGCDDGSCTFPGCTFAEACNYDANAGCNDGSCVFGGCTDPAALNYNPTAGCDNGSCVYTGFPGCTDATACNYNAAATVDNFTCTYPGCTDASACNFSVNAGCDDGSCTFPGCTFASACNYDATAGCNDGSCVFAGCTDPTALNYNPSAGCDNGACVYTGTPGCTDMTACNYDAAATVENFTCTYPGCSDVTACNYDMTAGCDDGSCVFPGCNDPAATNYDATAGCDDGSCIYSATPGCTNPSACNYDPAATTDNSSCNYPGCMDPDACNYEATAGCDDGSCSLPGCTNIAACNYDASAQCDDGSCVFMNVFEITGNQMPEAFSNQSYVYPCDAACSYAWNAGGGVVFGADDSCVVSIGWASAGIGTLSLVVSCDNGCEATVNYEVLVQPVSVNEVSALPTISIFPNPTLNESVLLVPDELVGSKMKVYNAVGAVVHSARLMDNRTLINASTWAAGVYSVVLTDGQEHTLRMRMIKE